MHTTDSAAEHPRQEPIEPVDPSPTEFEETSGEPAAAAEEAEPVLTVVEREQQVELQRSVRYGRVLGGGAIIGAAIAMLLSLLFPVLEGSEYTMGQIVGFMALIGGAIGLGLGGLLALVLGQVAKRSRGSGVAIQTDVQ